jgi:hypothetical protein
MTVSYYVLCAPHTLTASNNDIVVSEDGGADTTISLGVGDFYCYGDGSETNDLCKAIADALNNEGTFSNTYTATYAADIDGSGRTGAVTITTNGTSLNIKGAHANSTFDWYTVGHANATSGPFTSYSGVLSPSITWLSDQPPELVDGDRVEGRAVQHRAPSGGSRHTFVVEDPVEHRRLRYNFTHKERAWSRDSNGGITVPYSAFQYHWETHYRKGKTLRLYSEDISSGTTLDTLSSADLIGTFVMSDPLDAWRPTRDTPVPTWAWELELAEVG